MRKHHTHTISVTDLYDIFPNEDSCYQWLENWRWKGEPVCPHCGGVEDIRKPPPSKLHHYWCKPCRKFFTVTTGTVMHATKISLRKWIYAIYSLMTARKGVSAMQLSKELSVQYKTAWYMLHRIREACGRGDFKLAGVVEVDETYVGGKRDNMRHARRKQFKGRGTVGKAAVVGVRERGGDLIAMPTDRVDSQTLVGFVKQTVEPGSHVYTDGATAYRNLDGDYTHEMVAHSAGEYVRGMVHTNGIESAWALLKRAINGTWHHVSQKHLARYVNEVAFRLNQGSVQVDILDRMGQWASRIGGKRIAYDDLVAPNGMPNKVIPS
ncbi:MAG: IS1595 family transposase [Gammaproteobacteria bacterium]|nr:IS1595 family transposase [Gammaproteobacteria bacterium]MDE0412797.1 IS1595 family transposase [Gammaproteobacteria bacterium]